MKRIWIVCVLAIAGWPGGGGGSDAAIDAPSDGISIDGDGDAMPRICEESPPTPGQATTSGSVLGAWNLTWTCVEGCVGNRPGLTYARQLAVTANDLAFSSTTCVRCELSHGATPSIPGCVDVAAGADWGAQCRFSYRLCERSGTIEAMITWKEPGLSAQRWRLLGSR